ncbi:MAG: AAA family ATPase [Saprospiraceae bacterium]|nr:AAA family ATPase [Saprospiraceae bacterium]
MKNLPIGIQTLGQIRDKNCVYVDKTQLVHQLTTSGTYYFFSRPRRFGKSLLISTFKELYLGNRAVFEGLWIEDKWNWAKKNPVFHISFDDMSYKQIGLEAAILQRLNDCAKQYKIRLTTTDYKTQFRELLQKLAKKGRKVVVLIDEYDKPIIDFLEKEEIETCKFNRDILREFYGVLKNADALIEFVFITGISKFSKVSLFSHLNNLDDITLSPKYAALAGYTQAELESYFDDYLQGCAESLEISRERLLSEMKTWYNGYSWDSKTWVYNPFGTLNFLSHKVFFNHWFTTGSPFFLVKKMRELTYYNVENAIVNNVILDKYDIDNLELIPLLFQTGYLTVKKLDRMTGDMVLDYPNKEVRDSMYTFLIDDISRNQQRTHTGMTIRDINKAFASKDLNKVKTILNALLADLPVETYSKQTGGLFHGLIHLVFSYLGTLVNSEVHSSRGHADAVVQTLTDVYIFEFKFNKTAQEGLDQITKQDYAGKYRASGKMITGIGVNFNSDKKGIDEWLEAVL